MARKSIFLILFTVFFINQNTAQSSDNLKAINKVWSKFYEAFDSLEYRLMAEIHSKKLVRISGGKRISDYKTYIGNYKRQFQKAKENKVSNKISLRFFERINNDSVASERGIYKLIRTVNQKDPQIYYGQFHVLFAKENGQWKITMDYDSSEGNSIGEKDYAKAYGINELETFIKN